MPGIKITRFLGVAPRISPELLPDTAAQVAHNCKLYSGDLIPYSQPQAVGGTFSSGTIKTLYGLRNPDTQDIVWLSWPSNVSIAVASSTDAGEQRFYYTGDGAPKVSNYKLATSGSPPYPVDYYDLGLPPPDDAIQLSVTPQSYAPKTIIIYSRDSSNVATISTSTPHGLRTGSLVSVTGFTFLPGTYSQSGKNITVTVNDHGLSNGAQVYLKFTSGKSISGTYDISNVTPDTFTVTASNSVSTSGDVQLDLRSFNATNIECTVVDSMTLTYFSPGPAVSTSLNPGAQVELAGLTQARSYVFTWVTPWGEESIASKPSNNLYIKEGVKVTVTNIPTTKPAGKNFVRGVRLYRTLASASGTEYYRLKTLWFPAPLAAVSRNNTVARIKTQYPHNLAIDDRIVIYGCSDSSFDMYNVTVTNVVDPYTFEFVQAGTDVAEATVSSGLLYYDVAEKTDDLPRFWGLYGYYGFIDDFDSRNLFDILGTDEYDPPPKKLQGLTAIQNNVLVGFVGNTLYFSEPNVPHAWPRKYAVVLEHNIVGLALVSGALLVLTDSYPYLVSVNDPASGVAVSRIDAVLPCLNPKSIVVMNYGVVYSTHDGLAVYSPSSGPAVITKALYNNDTWQRDIDPSTVVGASYGDAYVASHSTGAFVFEYDAKIGGFFVTHEHQFTAPWYDSATGRLYYVNSTTHSGSVWLWGSITDAWGDITTEWHTGTYTAFGTVYLWDAPDGARLQQQWKSKVIVTNRMINLGAARVISDPFVDLGLWGSITDDWGDIIAKWYATTPTTFRLWADKELIFEYVVNDNKMFRLPTGYRTDTFEVGVEGSARVRAIHLAETPSGLGDV